MELAYILNAKRISPVDNCTASGRVIDPYQETGISNQYSLAIIPFVLYIE